MDAAAIETLLWTSAEGSAKQRGVRFGDGADGDVRGIASRAALEIAALSQSDQQKKIEQARQALDTLVTAMIEASKSIPNYRQDGVIGERTFQAAMSKLCPLWPIC
jgi:hypothetical protein